MQVAWETFWTWAAVHPLEAVFSVAGVIFLFRLVWQ